MKNKKKLIILILACIVFILCSQNVFASSVENVMLKNTGILEYTDNPYMPFYTTSHINENRIANKISSLFRSAVRATLPKQYRTEGLTVKDQKNTGECWAFAYTSAIEAYNIVHTGKTEIFSPRHIDYSCSKSFKDAITDKSKYFNREVSEASGNYFLTSAYAASRKGPVLESDMPFSETLDKINLSDLNKEKQYQIEDYLLFDSVFKKYSGNQVSYYSNSNCTEPYTKINDFRTQVKQQIQQNGAVVTCIYETSADKDVLVKDSSKKVNHGVCVVGWDDDYKAQGWDKAGAYIAINSYTTKSFYNGYIYISYDDIFVENNMVGITAVSDIDTTNVYEHDELGTTGGVSADSIFEDYTQKEEITAVNIFDRNNKEKAETLTEVGVSVWTYQKAEVYFTDEFGSSALPINWKLVASTDTIAPGFKTIRLTKPVELTKEKYAIAVRFIEDNEENAATVALEIPIENSWWSTAKGKNGESYVVKDKFEIDGKNTTYYGITVDQAGNMANTCIKAYTTIATDINSEKYEIRGNIITRVDINTDLESFKNNITVGEEGKEYKVLDANGNDITDETTVLATGYKVIVDSKEYTISVTGDISGDGKADILDLARMRAHVVGRKGFILSGANLYAADLSFDSQVDVLDVARMRKLCVQ